MNALWRILSVLWTLAAVAEAIEHPNHPAWHVAILLTVATLFFSYSVAPRR